MHVSDQTWQRVRWGGGISAIVGGVSATVSGLALARLAIDLTAHARLTQVSFYIRRQWAPPLWALRTVGVLSGATSLSLMVLGTIAAQGGVFVVSTKHNPFPLDLDELLGRA